MSPLDLLSWASLVLAAQPAIFGLVNLRFYRPPPDEPASDGVLPAVAILIPARNEEAGIAQALSTALASTGVSLEILVGDDHSSDRTAEIVQAFADAEPRLRLLPIPPLPPGWSGKQHACDCLGRASTAETLIFVDADVRLAPDAARRMAGHLARTGLALASGVPRQVTVTPLEWLAIPFIPFLLLGFLPIWLMRLPAVALGAGCGQLFVARRAPYLAMGGHAAIRRSLHDGLTLPRAFRKAGLMTGLFDATPLAQCRMYQSAGVLWSGFAKNATEGMAKPLALPLWTLILAGGQILPPALLLSGAPLFGAAGFALLVGYGLRLVLARRFRQNWASVALFPAGVALALAIQWYALIRSWCGGSADWRGRAYPAA